MACGSEEASLHLVRPETDGVTLHPGVMGPLGMVPQSQKRQTQGTAVM